MLEIPFPTQSPINHARLSGQNKRLYDYLFNGNKINCFSPAMNDLRIGYLNSRISDLINEHGVSISKKQIKVIRGGDAVTVVEYSIK